MKTLDLGRLPGPIDPFPTLSTGCRTDSDQGDVLPPGSAADLTAVGIWLASAASGAIHGLSLTLAPSFVYALPFLPVFASSSVAAYWDKERQEPFIVGPHTSAAAFWEKSPSQDLKPRKKRGALRGSHIALPENDS